MARIERLTTTDTAPEIRNLELIRRRLDALTLEYMAALEAASRLVNPVSTERAVRLLTTAQVADRLSVSEAYVKNLLAQGRLSRLKLGHATRILESEVERYVVEVMPS